LQFAEQTISQVIWANKHNEMSQEIEDMKVTGKSWGGLCLTCVHSFKGQYHAVRLVLVISSVN
jgi:hypothetical protein